MIKHDIKFVYGDEYIEGDELATKLTSIFCSGRTPDQVRRQLNKRFSSTIDYLYDNGILLRSLYDIETEDKQQIKRHYAGSYKLYLAPKGYAIYKMLEDNSVLMEVYRDDIETNIEKNDVLTYDLSSFDKFVYLLRYLEEHFSFEKRMIAQALFAPDEYIENIGNSFITAHLLTGLIRNYRTYFSSKGKEAEIVLSMINSLVSTMNEYAEKLNSRFHCSLSLCKLDI